MIPNNFPNIRLYVAWGTPGNRETEYYPIVAWDADTGHAMVVGNNYRLQWATEWFAAQDFTEAENAVMFIEKGSTTD